MENHIEWQKQETQPTEYENRKFRQFVWVIGVKQNEFDGRFWIRSGWGLARISNHHENILGYNREDMEKIALWHDIDFIDKVTHWAPCSVNFSND